MNSDMIVDYYISHNATLAEVIQVRQYLDELIDDSKKLDYLYIHGVDNWSGYREAMIDLYNLTEEDLKEE